jgi:hypothetical protein
LLFSNRRLLFSEVFLIFKCCNPPACKCNLLPLPADSDDPGAFSQQLASTAPVAAATTTWSSPSWTSSSSSAEGAQTADDEGKEVGEGQEGEAAVGGSRFRPSSSSSADGGDDDADDSSGRQANAIVDEQTEAEDYRN